MGQEDFHRIAPGASVDIEIRKPTALQLILDRFCGPFTYFEGRCLFSICASFIPLDFKLFPLTIKFPIEAVRVVRLFHKTLAQMPGYLLQFRIVWALLALVPFHGWIEASIAPYMADSRRLVHVDMC